jgi:LuxR family quorum-sensing system transcriptional regulator CciR
MKLSILNNQIELIEQVQSFSDLQDILAETTSRIGYEFFAFIQANVGKSEGILLQAFPKSWMDLMSETFAYTKSPILQAASVSPGPFQWSELPDILVLTKDQKQYLELAAAHGLKAGLTIPLHAPGGPSAMLSLIKNRDEPIDRETIPLAMYIGNLAFVAGKRIKQRQSAKETILSERDARVITLLCRGQSKAVIASRLGINISDINRTIAQGRKQYQVGSQTEMIVKALFEQSIRFEDVLT